MPKRQIITKRRIYEIAADAEGVPIVEYFKGLKLEMLPPECAQAKVYQTADGPVLALPAPPQPR
jgi:hypothetical protein